VIREQEEITWSHDGTSQRTKNNGHMIHPNIHFEAQQIVSHSLHLGHDDQRQTESTARNSQFTVCLSDPAASQTDAKAEFRVSCDPSLQIAICRLECVAVCRVGPKEYHRNSHRH
jgi:hypothetical protein